MKITNLPRLALFAACFITSLTLLGCATPPNSSSLTANSADVDTIAHIIRADYECLSGPAGPVEKVRQKQRDDLFYLPGAPFVSADDENGQVKSEIMTQGSFWAGLGKVVPAVYETEIGSRIERFGNVAQVRSVSAERNAPDGPIVGRYVNYSQLYWDGKRWWITGQVWQKETPRTPIPESWIGKWEEITR